MCTLAHEIYIYLILGIFVTCDSLRSIDINVDEDKMVQVCLGGLTQRFDMLRATIFARENPPSFFNLQSMVLVEENNV